MRDYASFFEWSDRQVAELGVAESFLASLAAQRNQLYRDLRMYSPDPPDCVCRNEQHELVAIEISEVVFRGGKAHCQRRECRSCVAAR